MYLPLIPAQKGNKDIVPVKPVKENGSVEMKKFGVSEIQTA